MSPHYNYSNHCNYEYLSIYFNKISSNGYVSFGQGYSEYVPRPFPLFISSSNSTFTTAPTIVPSIISPYWDDIDLTTTGNILYESYDESDSTDLNLLKTISNFITDSQNLTKIFECKSAVVVFWSNVCPFGDNNCNDVSNFCKVIMYVFASVKIYTIIMHFNLPDSVVQLC